ncbi:MAG: hypothetical protein FWH42_00035 [Dehalococcoidia bacterium]|nr:hypothetical protein [Dehalococcoidia bacterium]
MARNIHQRRAKNNSKAAPAVKDAIPVNEKEMEAVEEVVVTTVSPSRVVSAKSDSNQELMDARMAELPRELLRIVLFSVAALLIIVVLWFILKFFT